MERKPAMAIAGAIVGTAAAGGLAMAAIFGVIGGSEADPVGNESPLTTAAGSRKPKVITQVIDVTPPPAAGGPIFVGGGSGSGPAPVAQPHSLPGHDEFDDHGGNSGPGGDDDFDHDDDDHDDDDDDSGRGRGRGRGRGGDDDD